MWGKVLFFILISIVSSYSQLRTTQITGFKDTVATMINDSLSTISTTTQVQSTIDDSTDRLDDSLARHTDSLETHLAYMHANRDSVHKLTDSLYQHLLRLNKASDSLATHLTYSQANRDSIHKGTDSLYQHLLRLNKATDSLATHLTYMQANRDSIHKSTDSLYQHLLILLAIKYDSLETKIPYADTTSSIAKQWELDGKLNKGDTLSLSNRVDIKLNIADTLSLSNRVNLKFNTSDTTAFNGKSFTTAQLAYKMNYTDSATIYTTQFETDTMRTAIYNAIGSGGFESDPIALDSISRHTDTLLVHNQRILAVLDSVQRHTDSLEAHLTYSHLNRDSINQRLPSWGGTVTSINATTYKVGTAFPSFTDDFFASKMTWMDGSKHLNTALYLGTQYGGDTLIGALEIPNKRFGKSTIIDSIKFGFKTDTTVTVDSIKLVRSSDSAWVVVDTLDNNGETLITYWHTLTFAVGYTMTDYPLAIQMWIGNKRIYISRVHIYSHIE